MIEYLMVPLLNTEPQVYKCKQATMTTESNTTEVHINIKKSNTIKIVKHKDSVSILWFNKETILSYTPRIEFELDTDYKVYSTQEEDEVLVLPNTEGSIYYLRQEYTITMEDCRIVSYPH